MSQPNTVPGGWMSGKTVQELAAVNRPAETIMITEKAHVWPGVEGSAGNTANWGPGAIFSGMNWWNSYSPGEIPDGSRAAKPSAYDPSGPNGAVTAIHQNLANFAFADGHVKAMQPKTTNPQTGTAAQKAAANMWDATRQ